MHLCNRSGGHIQFQSTLPRGERQTPSSRSTRHISVFQSTLPRGERPVYAGLLTLPSPFQSTLPRGERHVSGTGNDQDHIVSIHAPARGATSDRVYVIPQ